MNLTKISDLLEAASLAVNNTQNNPAVQQQLEAYGLRAAQLQTGKQRLRTLEQKHNAQIQLQNERWALSQQINASLLATRDLFKDHARIAMIAFRRDPTLIRALGVTPLATRRWECVRQASYFYQQLQEQKLSLEAYGISTKEIQQIQANVAQLLSLKEERVHKKGLSEHGTQERKQAQSDLRDWVMEFRSIARVAFRSQPQMLEIFGIRVAAAV